MQLISDENKFLDELEEMSSNRFVGWRNEESHSLTLKGTRDYLISSKSRISLSGDRRIEFATRSQSVPSVDTSLNSLSGRAAKSICDLTGAVIGLVLTLPLWLLIPMLIKLDSDGPVFYTQSRVGKNRRRNRRRLQPNDGVGNSRNRERRRDNCCGQTFKVIKFRTMVHDAERLSGPVWATRNDVRITRVGSFLRRFRLDEIPQFLNVLTGNMSLVGPRPERPAFVKELNDKVDGYQVRLQVEPGITGLAQVEGTYDSSPATVVEKLKYDLKYIESWSLWLDFKILLKTVRVVLTGSGAH